jgi:hypothetical protein
MQMVNRRAGEYHLQPKGSSSSKHKSWPSKKVKTDHQFIIRYDRYTLKYSDNNMYHLLHYLKTHNFLAEDIIEFRVAFGINSDYFVVPCQSVIIIRYSV